MTLKKYLYTMAATTAICWLSFIVVLFRIDPYTTGALGLALFFISLFFAIWGTLGLLGFIVRRFVQSQVIPFRHIGVSLRQSLWFAILICLTLLLVSQQLLVWWMSLLLVLTLGTLEAFFLSRSLEARYLQKKRLKQRQ